MPVVWKEKVAVDAVAYGETGVGEEDGNEAKLRAFIDTLNGPDGTNNHLVVVSSGIPFLVACLLFDYFNIHSKLFYDSLKYKQLLLAHNTEMPVVRIQDVCDAHQLI